MALFLQLGSLGSKTHVRGSSQHLHRNGWFEISDVAGFPRVDPDDGNKQIAGGVLRIVRKRDKDSDKLLRHSLGKTEFDVVTIGFEYGGKQGFEYGGLKSGFEYGGKQGFEYGGFRPGFEYGGRQGFEYGGFKPGFEYGGRQGFEYGGFRPGFEYGGRRGFEYGGFRSGIIATASQATISSYSHPQHSEIEYLTLACETLEG